MSPQEKRVIEFRLVLRRFLPGVIVCLLLAACSGAPPAESLEMPTTAPESPTIIVAQAVPPEPSNTPPVIEGNSVTSTATAIPRTATPTTPSPTPPPTMAITPGPAGMCGLLLPAIAPVSPPATTSLNSGADLSQIPADVRPAVARMLTAPGDVALVAYRIGEESEGIYLNPETAMPLASVVKIIHLIAYVEAVMAGELNPQTLVPLADLEAYYLPNSDLSAHPTSVEALAAEGRVIGDPPAVRLEDVPRMMIEYSSNAATDYLHVLLGQQRIEETIIALGMRQQAAPCPFIGQFLLMGSETTIRELAADSRRYSIEVMNLTAQYAEDADFRETIGGWRGRTQRPGMSAQRLFAEKLNTQGSALDYANLMARIAGNSLGTWEKSVLIRRYLEWPTFFPANQNLMAWLGYKGGSLPGVLTSAYYAQPWWRTQPVVVALFYRDLPTDIYRDWLREQTHDELARWLLREPDAIPLLRAALESAP